MRTVDAHTSTLARTATGNIPCTAPVMMETTTVPDRTTMASMARNETLPSPVDKVRLNKLLQGYEHQSYIIHGFTHGFSLNFQGPDKALNANNSHSIQELPHIVQQKLEQELKLGRIAGPFIQPPFPNFKSSPIALREKSTPGKYRMLHNLSFPYDNNSVNYNIDKTFTTVKYQTLQDAIALIQEHFPSVYLAKSDIADAFRIIPISPTQYHLLGFQFEGKYYYEKMLSMGAAPSCQIFEVFSSSLQWILKTRYNITCIKVLDDFLFVQPS